MGSREALDGRVTAPTDADRDGARSEPVTGGEPRDGVLLFGADGRRLGASSGVDDWLTPPVATVAELAARFRQPDGMPLRLDAPGARVAVSLDGPTRRLSVRTERLEIDPDAPGHPEVLLVDMRPFRDGGDPVSVQRALSSVLAHELRTPMTAIFGGAELMTSPTISDTTRAEAARSLAREAQRLHRVVENLVALVRWSVDAPPEREPVLVQRVLAGVVGRAAALAGRSIELGLPPDLPPVLATEALVEQLAWNLLDHAIANSPPAAAVVVEALVADNRVEVHVTDAGPARDDAAREEAFDLFARGPRSGVDPSGANLAMVVSRRLAERLSGRLWATDRETGGETVLSLELAGDAPGEPGAQ